jgi:hypothetical protein
LVFALQIRGELRKLTHPLVALALLGVAAGTSALQASHVTDPYPGPSIRDLAGCLRIAFLQHATTLGFVMAAVLAAVGTADEAGRGALADTLIQEPRRRRVATVKLTTITLGMLASIATTTISLLITRAVLAAQGTHAPPASASGLNATLIDLGCSLPVLLLASAIALALALLTRSVIATIAVTATVFYLPLTLLQDAIFWATPTRWIVEWLHLDPFGEGVDYIADNSPYDHRSAPALAGGLLILTALTALVAVMPRLLSRAVTRSNERHA